jgi:hypothetical protein
LRSDRVGLKIAGLFALSFAIFFILFFGYEVLSSVADRSAASAQAAEEVRPITIDPKIADDLAKVLAADSNPFTQEVKDPFTDRGGLAGKALAASSNGTVQSSTGPVKVGSAPSTSGGKGSTTTNLTSLPTAPLVVDATRQRYDAWLARMGLSGDTPLDPRVFSIEDLQPVGIVDGGSGQQEVMFYSQAVDKTVSFPLGTMFYDGWLTELRPEGVVFSSNDDRRTVRMRSWSRSVRSAG